MKCTPLRPETPLKYLKITELHFSIGKYINVRIGEIRFVLYVLKTEIRFNTRVLKHISVLDFKRNKKC